MDVHLGPEYASSKASVIFNVSFAMLSLFSEVRRVLVLSSGLEFACADLRISA